MLASGGIGDTSLPLECGGGVQVTDGDGERIGGVGRFGDFVEPKETRHHLLNLVFLRLAVSDDRGLDG